MHYTIYKVINRINGKVYIGKHQTKDLNDGYMGSGKNIQRALKKYGVENFNKEILFIYENEELMNAKEKELVTEEFCLREDTYNICVGGQGGFSYINREGLNSPSAANEYWKTAEGRLKKSNLARNRTQDPRFHISRVNTIYKKYGELAFKTFLGKKHSEETKQKMSESSKGKTSGRKNSQFGSMWITNGTENKKIKKVDIIPEGWYKGRKINPSVV